MTRELITKDVDGALYEFEQMNTTTALKTLTTLTKLIGEPVMMTLGSVMKDLKPGAKFKLLDVDFNTLNADALAKAVKILIENMDDSRVVDLVKRLTSEKVLCDHKPIVFDTHFSGKLGHLFKVLGAALEAQYGSFLDALTVGKAVSGGTVTIQK